MNKPIYVGSTVLDFSKKVMYEFWYDHIKPKWGDKAKLLFTDTNSFCIKIQTDDVYKDIALDVNEWFDTSNYPSDHPSGIKAGVNHMVPGKMNLPENRLGNFVGSMLLKPTLSIREREKLKVLTRQLKRNILLTKII